MFSSNLLVIEYDLYSSIHSLKFPSLRWLEVRQTNLAGKQLRDNCRPERHHKHDVADANLSIRLMSLQLLMTD